MCHVLILNSYVSFSQPPPSGGKPKDKLNDSLKACNEILKELFSKKHSVSILFLSVGLYVWVIAVSPSPLLSVVVQVRLLVHAVVHRQELKIMPTSIDLNSV